MPEILVESKDFEVGEPVKVIMNGLVFTGIVTSNEGGYLNTTSGFFNLDAPCVKAYRIKEMP